MELECERLKTFQHWPHAIKPKKLAKVGFFYIPKEDCVKCAFCGVVVKRWCADTTPLQKHIRMNPLCPFMRGQDVGNVPKPLHLEKIQYFSSRDEICPFCGVIITEKLHDRNCYFWETSKNNVFMRPIHFRMRRPYRRLKTFKGWLREGLTVEEMVNNGFYFTGDNVKCFWCDGELKNIKSVKDHKELYPECMYAEFHNTLQNPLFKNDMKILNRSMEPLDGKKPNVPGMCDIKCRLLTFDTCILPEEMKYILADCGFYYTGERDCIRCFWCSGIVENWSPHHNAQEKHAKLYPECTYASYRLKCSKNEIQSVKNKEHKEFDIKCQICMDANREIVFMNCGHMLSCKFCASKVTTCPICQKIILTKMRVYLS